MNIKLDCMELRYESFFRSNYKELCYFVYKMTGDYFLAEDIIQEAFLKIFLKLPTLVKNQSLDAWIYKIIKNTAIDCLRKQTKWNRIITKDDYIIEGVLQNKMTTEEIIEKKMVQQDLYKKIATIEYDFREVIILKWHYELNLSEISELTGVPIGTVKSRLNRARLKLQRKLVDY